MERYAIAVVGAGASGLAAAWTGGRSLKGRGTGGVVLLEGNPRPGKKLLATGNGRCNLTNLRAGPKGGRYHGDPQAAVLLGRYPPERVLAEFSKLGLLCREESEGRVYPNSFQAAAVLQALWQGCEEEGVELRCGWPVVSVIPSQGGFRLENGEGRTVWAQNCILACGGMASPRHSCEGKGYRVARSLGHTVTPLSPSLVPLKTPSKACRALKGMRARAGAALIRKGKEIAAESGEVLFGDGQLSGICVFNLSARLREAGTEGLAVGLDLWEGTSPEERNGYLLRLRREHPALPASQLFSGALNLRIGQELVKAAGIDGAAPLAALAPAELLRAAGTAKDWRFPVTGPGPWESAQVTAGGVPLEEVDPATMGSRKCPGLYLAGELLDVDGDCGGYNLHWAWITGMAAGKDAAAKAVKKTKEGGLC